MKQILSLLFLLITGTSISFSQSQKVSFYFSAHPDDWQLFMGVNAFKDIAAASAGSSNRTVFIYTTAGEANCYGNGVNKHYYLTRQLGANRSVQFCSDIYSPHAAWSSSVLSIPGTTNHNILQLRYKNIVCYFLRLPDGCFEQNLNTMAKLANGEISTLSAVDSSTTYLGYNDLVETVRNIVDLESSTLKQPEVWIQASDWDPLINPLDHPDHMQTGRLATEVAARVDYANIALFEGYTTCHEPSNLSPEEIAMEASLHSQVCFGLTHSGVTSEWDPQSDCGHVEWTIRNYFRVYSTAINTKTTATLVKISPNPAGNTINVSYEVMENGPVNIALYDTWGRLQATILNETEKTGVYTINYDIAALPDANYVIYAKISGHLYTLKFTKL